jgi:import receptor subunit TOM70
MCQTVQALNARGTFQYLRGDLESALSDFNAALTLEPNNINSLVKRGSIYMEMNNRWAFSHDRAPIAAHCVLTKRRRLSAQGCALCADDLSEAAMEDFKTAVQLDANDSDVYYHRAQVCGAVVRRDGSPAWC